MSGVSSIMPYTLRDSARRAWACGVAASAGLSNMALRRRKPLVRRRSLLHAVALAQAGGVGGWRRRVFVCGLEQVAVRTGAGQFKDEDVFLDLVDEQPVGRYMTFAMICPVAHKRMVAIGGGQGFAICQLGDDFLQLGDGKVASLCKLVVALECRGAVKRVLHESISFQNSSREWHRFRVGSLTMRSPSSIAAMVSAFGRGSAEMVNGMRFSRMTVLMYTVITDDAERPMLSQKSTKRFLVAASSENVMLAMVFLHSFDSKTCVSYTKLTEPVKGAA